MPKSVEATEELNKLALDLLNSVSSVEESAATPSSSFKPKKSLLESFSQVKNRQITLDLDTNYAISCRKAYWIWQFFPLDLAKSLTMCCHEYY